MKIKAVCEYNELGFLIFAIDYPGAYVRGTTENEALAKFGGELRSYFRWLGAARHGGGRNRPATTVGTADV